MSWTFRHYPLRSVHSHAFTAAIASECADDQGSFRAFHDALFRWQDSIGRWPWRRFADSAAVPHPDRLARCVDSRRHVQRVRSDMETAQKLQVTATPTLIVNGLFLSGSPSRRKLDSLAAAAIGAGR